LGILDKFDTPATGQELAADAKRLGSSVQIEFKVLLRLQGIT
jgi:hypothetical protein